MNSKSFYNINKLQPMNTKVKCILSFVAGAVSCFLILLVISINLNANKNLVLFDAPKGEIDVEVFEVLQVLSDGSALATAEDYGDNCGLVVLFLSSEDNTYYDDQIIKRNDDEIFRQIGTYKYTNRQSVEKTVPVIASFNVE